MNEVICRYLRMNLDTGNCLLFIASLMYGWMVHFDSVVLELSSEVFLYFKKSEENVMRFIWCYLLLILSHLLSPSSFVRRCEVGKGLVFDSLLQQGEIRRGSQTLPHFVKISREQTTAAKADRGSNIMITTIIIITTSITNMQQCKITKTTGSLPGYLLWIHTRAS